MKDATTATLTLAQNPPRSKAEISGSSREAGRFGRDDALAGEFCQCQPLQCTVTASLVIVPVLLLNFAPGVVK